VSVPNQEEVEARLRRLEKLDKELAEAFEAWRPPPPRPKLTMIESPGRVRTSKRRAKLRVVDDA
jgi:hypothetical protein